MIMYLIWNDTWSLRITNPRTLINSYVMSCASRNDDRDAIIDRIHAEQGFHTIAFDGFTTRPFNLERVS